MALNVLECKNSMTGELSEFEKLLMYEGKRNNGAKNE